MDAKGFHRESLYRTKLMARKKKRRKEKGDARNRCLIVICQSLYIKLL